MLFSLFMGSYLVNFNFSGPLKKECSDVFSAKMVTKEVAIPQMNRWGKEGIPFLFFTDFSGNRVWLSALDDVDTQSVQYAFNDCSNISKMRFDGPVKIESEIIPYPLYLRALCQVKEEIQLGNSFLVNLTFQTPIQLSHSLEELFHLSRARYKLFVQDHFVCFSPEIFIQIQDGVIKSFPMKGTIDCALPHAEKQLLADPKELAEHVTIVDLIRNDMSMIAREVSVSRFRYLEEVKTNRKNLLQVSSEITGRLANNWRSSLGDVLFHLLPAGSISGAPKPKTLKIIRDVENYDRGFYTGVCGLFNGSTLDSGVMIRFIESTSEGFVYKSGGGITSFSSPEREYEEYQNKIYVPFF